LEFPVWCHYHTVKKIETCSLFFHFYQLDLLMRAAASERDCAREVCMFILSLHFGILMLRSPWNHAKNQRSPCRRSPH
jgi:hypothetical protein